MLDSDQSPNPTPAQVLAGTPPQAPPQPAPAPPQSSLPQPTPQQIEDHNRHAAIGRAASFLFGAARDPNTGAPVPQKPGSVLKSLLLGALLGGSLASEGQHSASPTGGFVSGLARGASGVEQQQYARQQAAQQNAMERQRMSLEQQRAADEHMLHQATAAKIVAETAAAHHQQEFFDQEQLDKKNAAASLYLQTLLDAGGTNAPIAINGQVKANGIYSAPELAAAFTKDPSILKGPPNTVRHFIDTHNSSDLEYVDGKGWTNQSGDPVDLSKSTTVRVIDVPENLYRTRVHPTGKELNAIAGYQLIPKDQEDHTFNATLDAISGLYAQNLKNANQQAQAKQRDAAAAKAKSQANKTSTPKRGTPAQFAAVEAKKAAALAKAEKQFENDGDTAALENAKAQAQKSYEDQVVALGGLVAPAGQAAPKSNARTFSPTKWKAANPNGDVNAAIAEAKRQGLQVIQ